MNRKLITPFDIFLILAVVLLSFAVMFFHLFSDSGEKVVVTVDNQVVAEFDLDSDITKRFETKEGYNIIVIKNGECSVKKANCRDGICVNHSVINKVGQSIVCLPHKLIVEIK